MTSPAADGPPISLLVVEDDDGERSLLVDALALRFPDLTVHQAPDGGAGLRICRDHAPDIVLADISMPVLDGIAMSRKILADFPDKQIIVISGNSDTEHLLEAIRLGIKQYLLKPLDFDVLFETIADSLRRLNLERQVKLLQEEAVRAQKLASLSVLAGGIAHDFNNVLTGILGNISCALALAPAHHPVRSPLFDAEEASQRAAQLAAQLLAFARGGKPVKRRVALHQLLEESVRSALSGSATAAVIKMPQDVLSLEVDDRLMHQAFGSILTNAAQAMPAGGTVTVEATRVLLERANILGLPAGEYLRITFRDAGCGIPNEVADKIFDPYFSTKPGCPGLGLSSTYSIVVNHGGHIEVRSRVGKGTAVICHLPAGASAPAAIPSSAPSPVPAASTGARVLIMDDEKIVRKVAGKMLESLGYRVTACADGEHAVELYRVAQESGDPFLTVLMDLTIPGGMGGKEAARGILCFDPQARLVVSSGYFDDPVMSEYREHGFWGVMPKPYKLSDVQELMGRLTAGIPITGAENGEERLTA